VHIGDKLSGAFFELNISRVVARPVLTLIRQKWEEILGVFGPVEDMFFKQRIDKAFSRRVEHVRLRLVFHTLHDIFQVLIAFFSFGVRKIVTKHQE